MPRFERNVRDEMQDRVPQARVYRVYHAPGWRDADSSILDAGGQRAERLAQRAARSAAGLREESGDAGRVGVIASEIASTFDRVSALLQARRRSRGGRAGDRRRGRRVLPRDGPTADGAAARAQSRTLADFVRGIEAAGRLRRPRRRPGREPDVRRQRRGLPGSPRAHSPAPRRRRCGPRRRAWLDAPHYTMVVRPFPKLAPATTTLDRKVLPPLGDAPDGGVPRRAADDADERPVGHAARAARDADRQRRARRRRRLRRRRRRPRPASLRSPLDLLDDGTTTRDTFRIVDELDALGARITTRQLARPVVRAAAGAAGEPRALAAAHGRRRAATRRSRPIWCALEQAPPSRRSARRRPQPTAAALRIVPRLLYGDVARLRQPVHRDRATRRRSRRSRRDDLLRWHRDVVHANGQHAHRHRRRDDGGARAGARTAFGGWPAGEAPKKSHRHGRAQRRRQRLPDRQAGRAAVGDRRRPRHRTRRAARRTSRSRRCCATSAASRRRA